MAESFPNIYKTLWEKEKSFIMSNFSFSNSVFKRLVLQTCHWKGLKVPHMMISVLNVHVVGNIVGKDESLLPFSLFPTMFNSLFQGPLTHYQTTNFRLFQTERVCRRQFQIGRK